MIVCIVSIIELDEKTMRSNSLCMEFFSPPFCQNFPILIFKTILFILHRINQLQFYMKAKGAFTRASFVCRFMTATELGERSNERSST